MFLQHDFCKEHHFLPSSLSERPSSVVLSILFILTSIHLSNCGNQFFTCLCLQHPTCCWAHNGSETELRVRGPIETGGDHLQWWELPLPSKNKSSSELLERDGTSEISDPSSSLTGGVNREVHHLAELQGERID